MGYRHTFSPILPVLEYSPIGVKFSPNTAPRTLYTVKKDKLENIQNFFVLVVTSKNICYAKNLFFIVKKLSKHFSIFLL
jgi:hypothetical protein